MLPEPTRATSKRPLVIVGGGLAGSLLALAMAARRSDQPILIIEKGRTFGGNHTWSFFDDDVAEDDRWLVRPLLETHWPDHEVRFPGRQRRLAFGYSAIRSERLHRVLLDRLGAHQWRLGQAVRELGETHVVLDGGERIHAAAVIDARGPPDFGDLELGWQKFLGRTFEFKRGHGVERPVIMDACVDQAAGYRFVYVLPFSETELLVEDTYYAEAAVLDIPLLRRRIDSYMGNRRLVPTSLLNEEQGVLPVPMAGTVESLWASGPAIPRIGLRGGFFHPTTGYSLPDAVANAIRLTRSDPYTGAALHDLLRGRATQLWHERSFYRKLNRMLFHAAAPGSRYRILEHFYRLKEARIRRFYAGRLTWMDKVRIMSGRPPVPIGQGLAALRMRAT